MDKQRQKRGNTFHLHYNNLIDATLTARGNAVAQLDKALYYKPEA
jgi:hypothetical protein